MISATELLQAALQSTPFRGFLALRPDWRSLRRVSCSGRGRTGSRHDVIHMRGSGNALRPLVAENELRIGMTRSMHGCNEFTLIVWHASMMDGRSGLRGIKDHVASSKVWRDRVADATKVHDGCVIDLAKDGLVCVANAHDARRATLE